MFLILFALFVIVPATELYLLFKVAGSIGGLNTFGLVLLTAFIGARLMQSQGQNLFIRVQKEMSQGQVPAPLLVHSLLVLLSGLLMLTPGFLTDVIGLSFLIPGLREVWVFAITKGFKKAVASGNVKFYGGGTGASWGGGSASGHRQSPFSGAPFEHNQPEKSATAPRINKDGGHDVIDAEYEKL